MKPKILIVKYLPGREFSHTALLYNHLLELVKPNYEINEIDLEQQPPPYFDYKILMAYYRRNYQGKELSADQQRAIAEMDEYVKMLKNADVLVVLSPMHNFGMPGLVKLWFDAVIQKGETFDYMPNGKPYGKMKGKKALVIFTSGGEYSCKQVSLNYPEWDTYSFHAKIMLQFIGFDEINVVTASTGNNNNKDKNLNLSKLKLSEIVNNWRKISLQV